MENYNKLKNILSSFHFGVIEHNNHQYTTIKDQIVYKIVDPNFKALVQNVISELISSDPAIADRMVAYLRQLMKDLSQISAENAIQAYEEFTNYLNGRFIKFTGPFITELKNPIVTTLFVNSLRYEVYLRSYIIKEIDISTQTGVSNDLIFNDWYDEERHIQPLSDNEVFKLFEADVDRNESKSNSNPSINTDKRRKFIPDFEKNILNDKGKKIFKALRRKYQKEEAGTIVYMLYALESEMCLDEDVDKLTGTMWAKVLGTHFFRSYDRKSLEYHLRGYPLGPTNDQANIYLNIELKKVKDIISEVS